MDVQAKSFRGFTIVGRGVSQEAADRAREEIEAVLEKHGVTAIDMDRLSQRYRDIGTGVDLQHFTAEDWRRWSIDPKHVRANKHLHAVLMAAIKSGGGQPGMTLGFRVEPAHA